MGHGLLYQSDAAGRSCEVLARSQRGRCCAGDGVVGRFERKIGHGLRAVPFHTRREDYLCNLLFSETQEIENRARRDKDCHAEVKGLSLAGLLRHPAPEFFLSLLRNGRRFMLEFYPGTHRAKPFGWPRACLRWISWDRL